ncbi:hypothetical protein ACNQO6_07570 [Acinetobacter calcoaceticus]
MEHQINGVALPNEAGFFGNFGGQFIPPHLKEAMDEINAAYEEIRHTAEFQDGLDTDKHSATLTLGKPGQIHGMACYVLEDANGEPLPVHSIASGLDYPGVGPQHSYLKELGRVQYETATDQECLDAFMTLSRVEGIVPALESSHAVAWALREAPKMDKNIKIVVNLSGRGDKDSDYVAEKLGL